MHHECPCADKLERHPRGGVADTPGTRRNPRAVPGAQLEQAMDAIWRYEIRYPGQEPVIIERVQLGDDVLWRLRAPRQTKIGSPE
jgi:hypothetical protein